MLLSDQRLRYSFLKSNLVNIHLDNHDREVEKLYSFPRDFRSNFWFNSLARFSILNKYIKLVGHSVLHVESDVILSPDFPLDALNAIEKPFAFPIVSKKRGIASTLLIKDEDASEFLWKFSQKMVQENSLASDMEILFQLNQRHPELVFQLPIAPQALTANKSNVFVEPNLGGCFDGHDFGVYLAGTNPWNARGLSKLHTKIPESLLQFESSNIIFDNSRKFVSLKIKSSTIPVKLFSLHITNKNPLFFGHLTASHTLAFWIEGLRNLKFTFHPLVWLFMSARFLKKRLWQN